jgi:hypothetical protein
MTMPPDPPPTLNYVTPPPGWIREIVTLQRIISVFIVGYLLVIPLSYIVMAFQNRLIGDFISLFMIIVLIAGVIFVIRLGLALYRPFVGIVLGILSFIPLFGLIVLVILNNKATAVLEANGIKV